MLIDENGIIVKIYDPSGTHGFAERVLKDAQAMRHGTLDGTVGDEHMAAETQAASEVKEADEVHAGLYEKRRGGFPDEL